MWHTSMTTSDWIRARESHYCRFLGPLTELIMHSTDARDVHIDLYTFPPNKARGHWTLISGGMSDRRQYFPEGVEGLGLRAELMLYARQPEDWMYNVLKGLSEMPFEERTFLHWHHTVPNGQPMTARPSELTGFFFLPPYFEKPEFDTLEVNGDKVDILWLVPITEAERLYAIEHGGEALEAVLMEADVDPAINESRRSMV
jgi:hypothetical protein